ncbi:MAG: thymidylate kinase [Methanomassiliicoccales archaeon PtaU1.Bin124]|nr:MAG: thymidylate kinase [Methanomassiliicoccales archaeon PtaU1.Bin124]
MSSQEREGMHIAIEGMDGVGKTTVSTLLAKRLGFDFVEKPLHYLFDEDEGFANYERIRDYVNMQNDRVFTSWFYGLGNVYLYHRFRGRNIVTDRHLVSNYLWSGTEASYPVFDCLVDLIGHPDFTFLLYADSEIVRSRLMKRCPADSDMKKAELIPWAYEKMEGFLKGKGMRYLRIDTEKLTPEEICNIIEEKLGAEGLLQ